MWIFLDVTATLTHGLQASYLGNSAIPIVRPHRWAAFWAQLAMVSNVQFEPVVDLAPANLGSWSPDLSAEMPPCVVWGGVRILIRELSGEEWNSGDPEAMWRAEIETIDHALGSTVAPSELAPDVTEPGSTAADLVSHIVSCKTCRPCCQREEHASLMGEARWLRTGGWLIPTDDNRLCALGRALRRLGTELTAPVAPSASRTGVTTPGSTDGE